MHLGEMDYVFVVKSSILGVKSRNDRGVQGIWHCYCGTEGRPRRRKRGSNKFRMRGSGPAWSDRGPTGEMFRQCRSEPR